MKPPNPDAYPVGVDDVVIHFGLWTTKGEEWTCELDGCDGDAVYQAWERGYLIVEGDGCKVNPRLVNKRADGCKIHYDVDWGRGR